MVSRHSRWLLLVEDNADDEHLARRSFCSSTRSEELRVAGDGQDALEKLRSDESTPVLVLLDLKLPRLSGVEVIMAMKDDDRLRTIPIVVLSSSSNATDIRACYELGCSAFVRKPLDYDRFMFAMGAIFDFWLSINETFEERSQEAISL
jgi:CheY-like chemotaxis protein